MNYNILSALNPLIYNQKFKVRIVFVRQCLTYRLGLSLYKKKYANFKIYRRYLGFIHTEHEDFNARMDYIIKQTTENICKYLDTKIRW